MLNQKQTLEIIVFLVAMNYDMKDAAHILATLDDMLNTEGLSRMELARETISLSKRPNLSVTDFGSSPDSPRETEHGSSD